MKPQRFENLPLSQRRALANAAAGDSGDIPAAVFSELRDMRLLSKGGYLTDPAWAIFPAT